MIKIERVIISLLRTLVLSSPVLVELQPWRGGTERRDTLPNIRLHAFNLFLTDIGGDDFTNDMRWRQRYFQDGRRPVIFDAIYESGFLPALRSLDIDWHSVWVSVTGHLCPRTGDEGFIILQSYKTINNTFFIK